METSLGRSEADFTRAVLSLANDHGLLAHWCRDSRHCEGSPGFPDLVIAGPGGTLFAELKMQDADTTAEQDLWTWTLTTGHAAAVVWRPSNYVDGTIEQALRQIS